MGKLVRVIAGIALLSSSHMSLAVCIAPSDSDLTEEVLNDCNDLYNSLKRPVNTDLLGSTNEAISNLYEDQKDDVLWLLRERLENGTPYEQFAIIRLFENRRIFALLQNVIDTPTESSKAELAGIEVLVQRRRQTALVSTARHFGLWNQSYHAAYPFGDTESWEALFNDTIIENPELFNKF